MKPETKSRLHEALMTPQETAHYLGTTIPTLATWRCTGAVTLPFVKLGHSVRYRREDLIRFIEANLHEAVR